ncbi:MAG: Glutathione S-transferase domain protein [Solirubrobacterales bacterium]|nr:Glutathione S-transferase domain protein [Solirubrobacterales bacterium]
MVNTVTLYGMKHSHPVLAARLMLRRKGISYNTRDILPGLHAAVVRFAGFPGPTVPAMQLGGHKVQGTLDISRALDEAFPQSPLFPADPAQRAAVEEAERWAHEHLQPIAMRVFRWAGETDNGVRAWMASEVMHWPAADVLGYGFKPVMMYWARVVNARADQVRNDLGDLPARLEHADQLMHDGVIGSDELNAADCQVYASLRLLAAHEDLHPLVTSYHCGRRALELVPDFPIAAAGERPATSVPAALPTQWLPVGAGNVVAVARA